MRHSVLGDHLQLLDLRAMHAEVLQLVHNSLPGRHWAQKKQERRNYREFTGVEYW